MGIDLQKANFGKRIIAFIFDLICVVTIAVGLAVPFSGIVGYQDYVDKLDNIKVRYQTEYNIPEITTDEYNLFTEQEKSDYAAAIDAANQALEKDDEAKNVWNIIMNLMLLIITIPLFVSIMVLEFIVPLMFGNGQTMGKKIFGIALMHKEGIRVKKIQLFARALLGKFVIGTMIPIYAFIYLGTSDMGIIALLIYLAAQVITMARSHTYSPIHDVMAGTIAVDMASQRIFDTYDQLLEHNKKIAAERAEREIY